MQIKRAGNRTFVCLVGVVVVSVRMMMMMSVLSKFISFLFACFFLSFSRSVLDVSMCACVRDRAFLRLFPVFIKREWATWAHLLHFNRRQHRNEKAIQVCSHIFTSTCWLSITVAARLWTAPSEHTLTQSLSLFDWYCVHMLYYFNTLIFVFAKCNRAIFSVFD